MNAKLRIIVLVLSACIPAGAYPIGGVPTALMAPDKTVTLNYYHAETRAKNPLAPDTASIENAFIGINPKLELDINNTKFENLPSETTVDVQYSLAPNIRNEITAAIGIEDITQQSGESSVYVALAKVVTPTSPQGPVYPVVRLHLGYGTEPRSAFFGGVQYRLNPEFAFVALTDGHNGVFGVGYYVPNTTLLLKAGNFGRARYVGVEYRLPFD